MSIPYTIKSRKGARGIRISVHSDGTVVVTKSKNIPKFLAEAFVKSKQDWIVEQIEKTEKKPKKLLAHYSAKDFQENKQKAYTLAHNRAIHFNQFYNFKINSISIRNQKTRWGSCSRRGNISFNYKIIFLPPLLQDYIIVHELCHRKAMNHKKEFWDLVSLQIPDYKKRKEMIKLY